MVVGLLDVHLAEAIDDEAPDVAGAPPNDLEPGAVGTEAGELGAVVVGDRAVGGADLGAVEGALGDEDAAGAGDASELVGEEVGILDAEAGEEGGVLVGASVAVGIAVETDFGAVLGDGAVLEGQHAEGHGEALGEDAGLLASGRGGGVEDEDAVLAAAIEQRAGLGGGFVGVHRIVERRGGPKAAGVVEGHGDELPAVGLGGDQFDHKAFRNGEGGLLLLGGEGGGVGRLGRDGGAVGSFPWGKLLDRDVSEGGLGRAAAVDLEADPPAHGRDRGVGLVVVHALDAVDPCRDAAAVGADDVFVPVGAAEHLFQRGHVGPCEDAVAAGLVVDGTPPRGVADVALVPGHLGGVGDAVGADLDAGIDEARAAEELELEAEDEVGMAGGGGEELVLADGLGEGTADDGAVEDAPQLGVAFPALQRLAIEKGHGLGCRGRGRGGEGEGGKERRKEGCSKELHGMDACEDGAVRPAGSRAGLSP